MRRAYINANIITGNKDDNVIQNGVIIVDDFGKLEYVGKQFDKEIEKVDLGGKYVMPGLINAHIHMFTPGSPTTDMNPEKAAKFMKMLRTGIGKKLMKRLYRRNVETFVNCGVTTVRDVGSYMDYDLKIRSHIEKGEVVGPRVLCSGGIVTSSGGHAAGLPGSNVADGKDEIMKAVRENFHKGVDWIKICNTGGVADSKFVGEAGLVYMRDDEVEIAVEEAHKRRLMVASHTESTEGLIQALKAGVDTIEHGADFDEEIAQLFLKNPKALRGYTSLIPTLSAAKGLVNNKDKFVDSPGNKVILANAKLIADGCIAGFQKALKYDIKVGVGTDSSVPYVTPYNTYKELVFFKENSNLSNTEIIEIATKQTADILNVGDVTGELKTGMDADFIVLDKNPLDDLNNIKDPTHVINRGYFIENPSYKKVKGID